MADSTYDGRSRQPSDPDRFLALMAAWQRHLELPDHTPIIRLRRLVAERRLGGRR